MYNIPAAAPEYARLLPQFVSLCDSLISRGQSYTAVIMCHELYRFLYPVEPYANIELHDPVTFITDKIKTLINIGQMWSENVVSYSCNAAEADSTGGSSKPLEIETSNLYTSLWRSFKEEHLTDESRRLMERRIPPAIIDSAIRGKRVLDMGCGSGRYTLALAAVGAKSVIGVDVQRASFERAEAYANEHGLPVTFRTGNFLELPFSGGEFDFVFCNGTLHHSESTERGLAEFSRVLNRDGKGFLYLYASGGIYWGTRVALREIFKKIPLHFTQRVLETIGMPGNRFIFCDTWYVPKEEHISRVALEEMMNRSGLGFKKVISQNPFDLDRALAAHIKDSEIMWGDGEHRYIVHKA